MAEEATRGHPPPDRVVVSLDCRYAGQSHELTVPEVGAFEAEHTRRHGYALEGARVEVMAIRASLQWRAQVHADALPATPGRCGQVTGPQFVAEPDCTIWVAARWRANVDPSGSWILTREN
jgi:5-oxoprolinase (ATP-hydrolysing)